MGQHQGGAVALGNDVCHCKRLAAAGNAQQRLELVPGLHPLNQLGNGLGLVTGGSIGGYQLKGLV